MLTSYAFNAYVFWAEARDCAPVKPMASLWYDYIMFDLHMTQNSKKMAASFILGIKKCIFMINALNVMLNNTEIHVETNHS